MTQKIGWSFDKDTEVVDYWVHQDKSEYNNSMTCVNGKKTTFINYYFHGKTEIKFLNKIL